MFFILLLISEFQFVDETGNVHVVWEVGRMIFVFMLAVVLRGAFF